MKNRSRIHIDRLSVVSFSFYIFLSLAAAMLELSDVR